MGTAFRKSESFPFNFLPLDIADAASTALILRTLSTKLLNINKSGMKLLSWQMY